MKLQDGIDYSTLSWVKRELDETLKQARQSLEAYVEEPADTSLMRFCASYLHQVQGTLRMVELYGAAMVVDEMERVALGLLEQQIKAHDDTYAVLMRGMVQMPDYLERLQSGHKDIPIVLLPLLNDLRATRGEKLLTESALFSPDLSAQLPAEAAGAVSPMPEIELKAQAARLRSSFQLSLLRWIREDSPASQLQRLIGVLDQLRAACCEVEACKLWWIATGVLESVASGGLEATAAVKLLFGKVDREIKRLVDAGEGGFHSAPPVELLKNLLYYVAHSNSAGERATAIRAAYQLDTLLPSEKELEHAKGSISGHNRALLDTVSGAIKDDLLRVKEALDIFLRAQDPDPADLLPQAEVLDRVGDTLGMLGLGVPRRVVLDQCSIIQEIGNKQRPADESTLLDVAGSLLYVEASLDDHIEHLGAQTIEIEPEAEEADDVGLPKAEVRKILATLITEVTTNIAQAKQDVVAFIESPWDHDRVEPVPKLLEEISGAMRMLSLPESAKLITGIVRFIEVELLRHRRVPTAEQLDKLADAMASIEYYMEATRDERSGREKILDITRESLSALGYWPIPDDDGGGPAPTSSGPDGSPTISVPEFQDKQGRIASDDAHRGDFPRWNDEISPPPEDAPSVAGQDDDAAFAELPGIDLGENDLENYVSRIGEPGQAPAGQSDDTADDADALIPDVDVSPGRGLDDLVVGTAETPLPPSHDVTGLRLAETQPTQVPDDDDDYVEIEELFEEEIGESDDASVIRNAGFGANASEDIDEEIREVFVEEVREEIDNINRCLDEWKQDTAELDKLVPLRRSFHTLKGSGRLVGAMALGEFSWKVENMLNRVLDRTIGHGPAVLALVEKAVAALPEFQAALRGEESSNADIAGIEAVADALAEGQQAWLGGTEDRRTIKRVVKRRVPADQVAPEAKAGDASDTASVSGIPELDSAVDLEDAFAAPGESSDRETTGEERDLATEQVPNLDPVLFDILKSEVTSHLQFIDAYLNDLHENPVLPASEVLLRAVHTLNGAIAMVDIPTIGHVLAPLENYIKRLRAGEQAPNVAGSKAMHDAVDLIRRAMMALEQEHPHLPDSSELSARIAELRDGLPEPDMMHPLFSASAEAAVDETANLLQTADEAFSDETADTEPSETVEPVVGVEQPLLDSQTESGRDASDSALDKPTDVETVEDTILVDDGDALTASWLRELEGGSDLTAAEESFAEQVPPSTAETVNETKSESGGAAAESQSPESFVDQESLNRIGSADEQTPESADAAAENQDEIPETVEASAPSETASTVVSLPPMIEDAQPDGRLEIPDLDEDLLEIFVQESGDILDHSDSLMAKLRDAPQDRELVTGLQRDLHTLKGGARMAGLAPIGDLSHAMESLFDAISENRRLMDGDTIESLERGFDRLHGLVQRVARRQAIAMPEHAISRFEGLVSGDIQADTGTSTSVEKPIPATPESSPTGAEQGAAASATPQQPVQRVLKPTLHDEEAAPIRAPQEMIRVRSDLLDSLVNYAGEVSIYRSRLEQQITTFRFNLIEFEQTVSRLRDQLRKLELETEAQILSRFQREAEAGAESSFDPLELDRFSQLQQLSRGLAESVSDLVSIQGLLDDLTRQSETLLLQQSRVSSDLQEGLMRTRMVPFDSLVPSLRRTVRQAAQEVGKRAQLKVEGAQGEMDRNLLERMKAPFEHMLRNAVAHGIESADVRQTAGKPAEGTVTIQVSREATEVVLRVSDDGRGLDRDAIREKAIDRGLLKPDAQLSDRDLYGFILETGFSTAEQVTQLAGRGVGMDVVHNEIKQLGGSLAIDSVRGGGTAFVIRLPFTLAVTQAILLRLGEAIYAAPMSAVQGVVRIAREDLARRMSEADPSYTYAGEDYRIYDLSQLLNVPPTRISDEAQLPLLMTRTGDQRAAVRIDAVVGSREIVVKSVGPQISSVPGIFGATIMGDGSVVMILDLAPLVRRVAALREQHAEGDETAIPVPVAPVIEPVADARLHPLIMVVDDSITMRKVTTRVLERNEMDVVTAKDGLDAVEKLQDKVPDVVLLDVEMPRMDGYELATYMKNDQRLKGVPIIMITSRTGEKHRQRALEIGVERYLGKPYQESDLLQNVQESLRLSRA